MQDQGRQPYLHEHITCVAAPTTWLSGPSGALAEDPDGLYVEDRRVLARFTVTVAGHVPVPIGARRTGAATAEFTAVVRELGDEGPDPTVTLTRHRTAVPDGGVETLTLTNNSHRTLSVAVDVRAATDFARMGAVKDGRTRDLPMSGLTTSSRAPDGMTVTLAADPPPTGPDLTWDVTLPPRRTWTARIDITRTDITRTDIAQADIAQADTARMGIAQVGVARMSVAQRGSAPVGGLSELRVRADDRRLDELVRAGVEDLDALRRADGPDVYYTAGSPWYLTLFGRDSLWAARLALPMGTAVAAGTLRALARRQGARHDPDTDEEPGKILHEVRPPDASYHLPPVYYGTVDATALWVSTLADAWRWGLPPSEVEPLLSNVERALDWLAGHDGFIAYRASAKGLTNHGWKDSGDGVQHADGRIAEGPLALCEVQAYAYRAALDGAALLDAFGRGGGDRWRAWAADLAERFRKAFWCPGGYPAIALDGSGAQVDSVASNMGHLLGTGLLNAEESRVVAGHVAALASPFGVRTVAPGSGGYNPLSYHLGSVWPHDTAIALLGLARDGHRAEAAALVRALVAAGERFGFRLPELYGGDDAPTPYPAACRPQAWSAAAGPALLTALLGLDVDVPAGRVTISPLRPSPVGGYRIRGLRIGSGALDVSVTADGAATVHSAPAGLTVQEVQ
ncbi:amylo-alpha-1,6-glucosidase [Dactylosporangium vinaceum]|uniref:Glycogen debranching N-terminal domain-containing protein n=1 Tax=Dactylosporangium vinaceum TaxID=53362 RepID=A0ABV5MRJ8_9ACTN|nr:glycogen debranching N-terminal domain-containing protein [Dactylosporangium vinaceum]UAC01804.1 amylo-alpha-1,6-glucosidase [Dactylosporangium vinaceum]